MLFKGNEMPPVMTEDRGHALAHPASAVGLSRFKVYPLLAYSGKIPKPHYLFFQGWTKKAERIRCPAPLPEEPAIPLLAKMLVPAPYQAPEKKAKGARSGLHRKGASDVMSEDIETHSSTAEDDDEGKEEEGGLHLEAEASKKGKLSRTDNFAWVIDSSPELRPRDKP